MMRPVGRTLFTWIAACLLIALSLYCLSQAGSHWGAGKTFRWTDTADYRYLAESFWGIKHDMTQYSAGWMPYQHHLDLVPMRGILPGTYLLILDGLVTSIYPQWGNYNPQFGLIFSTSLKIMLVASYLFFFHCCYRRFGTWPALAGLALLLFPVWLWYGTENTYMAEPILRSLFVVILGVLIHYHKPAQLYKLGWVALLIIIVATHIKAQWFLLSFAVLTGVLWLSFRQRWNVRQYVVLAALAVAAPASLLAVNQIGWGYPSLTPGSALHANYKTKGNFVNTLCRRPDEMLKVFCGRKKDELSPWWKVYQGDEVSREQFMALDKKTMPYFFGRPVSMLRDFASALLHANPLKFESPLLRGVNMLFTIAVYGVLLMGLCRKQTMLISLFGLSLWVIPAVGNIFAAYTVRYFEVSCGIVPLVALLVLVKHWQARRARQLIETIMRG